MALAGDKRGDPTTFTFFSRILRDWSRHDKFRKDYEKTREKANGELTEGDALSSVKGNSTNPAPFRDFMLAQNLVPEWELRSASFTSRGAFICRIAPRLSFKNWGRYIKRKGYPEPLDKESAKLVRDTVDKYKLKKKSVGTITVSETYGRGLAFKFPVNGPGEANEFIVRFTKLREEWIHYKKDNPRKVDHYKPWIMIGKARQPFRIEPEDAVLFIGEEDPEGNGYHGVPRLVSPYYAILRAENIEEAWAETINIRGMGLVDFLVEGAEGTEDLELYQEKYGDPSSYKTFFHNEEVKVQVFDGMKASFDFDSTMHRFTKDVSSATGYPGTRMEGDATPAWGHEGAITNMAEQYNLLHESYEEFILKLIKLCEPRLKDVEFDIDWIYDIKLDERNKAIIRSTNANTIATVEELILVKEAREMLLMEPFGDERDDMSVSEYISTRPHNMIEAGPGGGALNVPKITPNTPAEITGEVGGLTSPKTNAEGAAERDMDATALGAVIDGVLQECDREDRVETMILALNELGASKMDKDTIARLLVHAGDDYEQKLSNTEMNSILTPVFGSGKNYGFYADERKKEI